MIKKECPECRGEGEVWEDTSHSCNYQPWQECCGGCGDYVKCDECDGEGEIEIDEEE
jgi:DnaJ-class molecular chaperone